MRPKYVFRIHLCLKSVIQSSPNFRNRSNFVLTLGHHSTCPKTILRLQNHDFGDNGTVYNYPFLKVDRIRQSFLQILHFYKRQILNPGGGIVIHSFKYVYFNIVMLKGTTNPRSPSSMIHACLGADKLKKYSRKYCFCLSKEIYLFLTSTLSKLHSLF